MTKKYSIIAAIVLVFAASGSSNAGIIDWVDWTSATPGAAGSASGNFSNGVTVNYSGDVRFSQLGSGTNYWLEGTPAPYTNNSVIDNAPTASEMVAMARAGITNTITFSEAVLNPVFAIVSQGRSYLPVTYDFDTSFSVLSEGRGYWGDGSYSLGAGDTITGRELHGALQFNGLVTSISWTANRGEYWHGFTVGQGVSSSTPPPSAVPEPATMVLFGAGLTGVAALQRRRRR